MGLLRQARRSTSTLPLDTVEDLKSSGKCFKTLKTGKGAIPPRAHNEPTTIVSHNSFSSTRLAVSFTPLRILSITSTPRTAPMRHGVHLPHDSTAQNSIANRACS